MKIFIFILYYCSSNFAYIIELLIYWGNKKKKVENLNTYFTFVEVKGAY